MTPLRKAGSTPPIKIYFSTNSHMTHHGSSQTAWLSLAGGRKIKKRSMEYYTKKEIQNLLDRIDNLLGEKNPKKEDMKDLLESISYILKPMVEEKNEESLF